MKTIDRANAAKRLKDNDDFKAIMACIEADIVQQYRNTKIGDNEKLMDTHALQHGFGLISDKINKYIEIAIFENSRANQTSANSENY